MIASTPAESRAVRELISLPDRAAAIVGAALVESRLDAVLKGLLADLKLKNGETLHKRMFHPSGSLGSFDTKINLAYMLGVYEKQYWQDLNKVRKIRNAFAHKLEAADFEEKEVAKLANGLSAFEKHYFEQGTKPGSPTETGISPMLYIKGRTERLSTPRSRYLLCVTLYVWKLDSHPRALQHRTQTHAEKRA